MNARLHRPRARGHGRATVARQDAGVSGLRRLVDTVFAGNPEALLTQLVNDRGLTREKLARLRALLDERLREPEQR